MCKARELNERSRELINNGIVNNRDVLSCADGFGEFLRKDSIKKEEMTKRIAGMQILLLALCGKFEISDEEVIDAACRIFDKNDKVNKERG